MVRRPGIEPGPPAWKAGILTTELTTLTHVGLAKMVTGVGFEPTPPKRLVPKTSALDHSANQSTRCYRVYVFQHMSCVQGGLAQLVECDVRNVEAAGSKPAFSIFAFGSKSIKFCH